MKRFRRIILNTLTVLSLLLCVATVGLWVRSYWADDFVQSFSVPQNQRQLLLAASSCDGHVYFSHETRSWENSSAQLARRYSLPPGIRCGSEAPSLLWTNWLETNVGLRGAWHCASVGVLWRSPARGSPWTDTSIAASHAWLLLGAAVLPAGRGVRRMLGRVRRLRRSLARRCVVCSYDLRATPDRCPECGTIPPK